MILPQPKELELLPGHFRPRSPWEGETSAPPAWLKRLPDDPQLGHEGYVLEIRPDGASLRAGSETGYFYGLQSLRQVCRQASKNGDLPCLHVKDQPDFAVRGLSIDISRGRVPKLESLFETVDALAELKINQLQLYTEHTFAFQGHPEIGKGCSPLTAADILALDAYCIARHIELVPSFASLGHMAKVLKLAPYHHLAEDFAEKRYSKPGLDPKRIATFDAGWTLAPGRDQAYNFLRSLYQEYLPLFQSKKFNVCCDEPYDLGWGQSYEAEKELGHAEVFARHVEKLRDLALSFGKTKTIIWSDPMHGHPELKDRLPKDLLIQDWMYNENSKFEDMATIIAAGFETVACPSTNSWTQLFPRLPMANANVDKFAAMAVQTKAAGILNTIWGDHGHYNAPELEWHGIARAAEKGWNAASPSADYTWRFSAIFLGIQDPAFARAIDDLGAASTLHRGGTMHSFWPDALFASVNDPLFTEPAKAWYWLEDGQIKRGEHLIQPAEGDEALATFARVRPALQAGFAAGDFRGFGDAYLFSVDASLLAAEKWARLGSGQADAAKRDDFEAGAEKLSERFGVLWRQRSQESEIAANVGRFENAAGTGARKI